MNYKINFFIVGIFILGLTVSLFGFLFWMGKFGFGGEDIKQYTVEIRESVSGLNIESPVKFRGVEVGSVEKIHIKQDNSEVIQIVIKVGKNTPVKEDSIAELTAQGITGLSYIELKGGSNASALLKENSIIEATSNVTKLENNIAYIGGKLVASLNRVDKLLSDKNLESVNMALKNLLSILNRENSSALEEILKNTVSFSRALKSEESAIKSLIKRGLELEVETLKTVQKFNTLAASLKNRVENGEYDIRKMSEYHLESFSALVKELRLLSTQSTALLEQLQNSPSDIIFKEQKQQYGPGE